MLYSFVQNTFAIFFFGFVVLWLCGVLGIFFIYFMAKKHEISFFEENINNGPRLGRIRLFWHLMGKKKYITFRSKKIIIQIKLLKYCKYAFFVFFIVTFMMLIYIWTH